MVAGCAPALRPLRPLPQPPAMPGASAAELLAQAEASFARRPDRAAVRRADELFLAAAAADGQGVDGLLGAIRAKAWLLEHREPGEEPGGERREALAVAAVEAGQWCLQRAPGNPACHHGLALGLGLQARERPATATEGLKLMVEELRRAAAGDPAIDSGGPERVLALVLLRAPAWPIGPGDAEEGLSEARKAAARFPDHPPNQLALAEALRVNGAREEGREAARRAVALARALAATGDPDAPEWVRQGERLAR
jgi:hypothetical protein